MIKFHTKHFTILKMDIIQSRLIEIRHRQITIYKGTVRKSTSDQF